MVLILKVLKAFVAHPHFTLMVIIMWNFKKLYRVLIILQKVELKIIKKLKEEEEKGLILIFIALEPYFPAILR